MTATRRQARSTGPTYTSLLEADPTPAPAPLLREAYEWVEGEAVDVARYTSREFHELETERLWPSTWQMACRLEHIPEVGDHIVYEICDQSLIVVRVAPDEVRAFHNSCLHRETTLVGGSGNAAFFKCPFHGFTWGLDGTFRGMPAEWDFPQVERADFCLPQAAVALWGGFVMVNPDRTAPPFEEYAAPLPEYFEPYPLERRHVAHHACQVVDANWKTTQEAFLEGYHVSTTHPHAALRQRLQLRLRRFRAQCQPPVAAPRAARHASHRSGNRGGDGRRDPEDAACGRPARGARRRSGPPVARRALPRVVQPALAVRPVECLRGRSKRRALPPQQ